MDVLGLLQFTHFTAGKVKKTRTISMALMHTYYNFLFKKKKTYLNFCLQVHKFMFTKLYEPAHFKVFMSQPVSISQDN